MNGRRREIDICKGILTLTMILCHSIQFFGFEDKGLQSILAAIINLATFSGFLFCFGYAGNLAYYQKEWKQSVWKMGKNALRILIAFYISGLAYVILVQQKIFRWDFITEILLLKKFPGWSEFLASFAAVLLVGILLFPVLKRMNRWMMGAVVIISAVSCFLPYDRVHNSWLALFVGSRDFITFPVLQYGVFFAAGIWMCKKKIGWNLWILLGSIAASVPYLYIYLHDGYLPERFPPSVYFIGGGCVFVYLYYLLSIGLEKTREKNRVLEWIASYLEQTGRDSLHYLLMSNILIFALAGSHFSYRSENYAYAYFVIILLLISYLGQLKSKRNVTKNSK